MKIKVKGVVHEIMHTNEGKCIDCGWETTVYHCAGNKCFRVGCECEDATREYEIIK